VEITTAIGAVFAAFGLSGAAGLNAWLPLLASALLDRFDVVELAAPFDQLSTDTGLVVLGVVFVADLVGDKVPAVDHVLHAVGTVVHPAAGAALFVGPTGVETEIPTIVAVALGALTAGSIHAGRATLRPASTATTAGIGNPVVSAVEDVVSAVLTAFAFLLPVLAFLLVLAMAVALIVVARRLRRTLGAGRPG
jgi:hypothetical protein